MAKEEMQTPPIALETLLKMNLITAARNSGCYKRRLYSPFLLFRPLAEL